jgi:hypothetical protein
MGLFGKKKMEICPVCGGEMDAGLFGDSKAVVDGIICGKCEKMLRGKYDIQTYVERGIFDSIENAKEKRDDPLSHMTVAQIKSLVDDAKAKQAEAVAQMGASYSSVLTAELVFMITPKPLDVGIKRAKELKNKLVVRGLVQAGTFKKGDEAVIVHDGSEKSTTILDVIPCDGVTDFDLALKANMHKKEASADTNAWIITNEESGVKEGDVIALK